MDEARLREFPLFAELPRRQLAKIVPHTRVVEVDSGDELVHEGDLAHEFFLIESGRAAVIAGGRHVTDLGPGDFLGEIGLMRSGPRTASVVAAGPVRALVVDEEGFRQMSRSMPGVVTQIQIAMRERLERDGFFGLKRD